MTYTLARTALWGTITAATLACGLAAAPAKALTLVDNTNNASTPITTSPGFITTGNKIAFAFDTTANWRPYTQFNLTVPLSRGTVTGGPLTDLTIEIFNDTNFDGTSAPANLVFSKSFTSQVGRYNSFLAPFVANSYNKFWLDTSTPLLASGSRYVFAFSSTTPFTPTTTWGIGGSSIAPASNPFSAAPFSTGSFDGTTWTATSPSVEAGFFLDGVPGPLPVLGAGSAFAWSRRLRRRVSMARKPDSSATPA